MEVTLGKNMAKIEKEKRDAKSINVDQVVSYLSYSFGSKIESVFGPTKPAKKGNDKSRALYWYQVEFCYLVDDIQRGPVYLVPKIISEANEFIANIRFTDSVAAQ
jgi:hypothetical protein